MARFEMHVSRLVLYGTLTAREKMSWVLERLRDAMDELTDLRRRLAAAEARNARLETALYEVCEELERMRADHA